MMATLMTALLYEAGLDETVSEVVQYRVIRQSYTLLLTLFGFIETGVSFLFPCELGQSIDWSFSLTDLVFDIAVCDG